MLKFYILHKTRRLGYFFLGIIGLLAYIRKQLAIIRRTVNEILRTLHAIYMKIICLVNHCFNHENNQNQERIQNIEVQNIGRRYPLRLRKKTDFYGIK